MAKVSDQAFVTLATNDSYALGALVLGASLRSVKTTRQVVCMITADISERMRGALRQTFDDLHLVDLMDSRDQGHLLLLDRPDLGVTFTKLHCWCLVQYSKCVFLDADTLVIQNCDELFEREELSAAPDPGWPDCFNSGVFVFSPSLDTYNALVKVAKDEGSFDGGDQGLLNTFFSDWSTKDISKHLPFIYNVVSQAFYSYLPAFRRFGANTRICHFIGAVKPWHCNFNTETGQPESRTDTGFSSDFLNRWWNIFRSFVIPLLTSDTVDSLMPQVSGLTISPLGTIGSGGYLPLSTTEHRSAWEQGAVDYTGLDSFENIKKYLDEKLTAVPPPDVRPKNPISLGTTAATSIPETSSKLPKKSVLKKPHQ